MGNLLDSSNRERNSILDDNLAVVKVNRITYRNKDREIDKMAKNKKIFTHYLICFE